MRPGSVWLSMLALLTACRASVDGRWAGDIGGSPTVLRIEQTGSDLGGEVCNDRACADITRGSIDGPDVEITYGCDGCVFPATTLDLTLAGAELLGEAYVEACDCAHEGTCDCRRSAAFHPDE